MTGGTTSRWFRFPGLAYLLVGCSVSSFQVVRMASSSRLGLDAFAQDDAYYYFRIAQNIALGKGSTWDGIHATNGYHPLWMLLLIPLLFVFRGRVAGMVVPKVLAGALWIVDAVQLRAIAVMLGAESTYWIGMLPAAAIAMYEVRSPPFNGVETPILLTTLVLATRLLLASGLLGGELPTTRDAWRRTWWCGLALALVVLSRLDAVSVAGLFGLGAVAALVRARRPPRAIGRVTVALATPTAVLVAVYCAFNRVVFETWLPVSGQAKALPPPTGGWSALHAYFTDGLGIPLPVGPGLFATVVVILVVASFGFVRGRTGTGAERRRQLALLVGLAYVGGLALMVYYDRTTSWKLLSWYYYAATFVLLVGPGIAIANVATWWATRRVPLPPAAVRGRTFALAVGVGVLVLVAVGGYATRLDPRGDEDFFVQSASIARHLDHTLPSGAILAMGDRAGIFGYELDRPVVSIEGIVNDTAFLHALQDHRVIAALRRDRVGYYVRSINADEERHTTPRRDQGGITPGTCGRRAEPLYGIGPKTWFGVCAADLVFATPKRAVESLAIWRFRPTG